MAGKAVVSLTTGLEDPEQDRPTLMFLTREATRLALEGVAPGSRAMAARTWPSWSTATPRRAGATWSARSTSTPASSTRAC